MKNKDLIKLIPNKVRITSKITYEIVWIDSFPNDPKQMGETRCSDTTKQIVISKSQPEGEIFKTFIHEYLHAVALENEIELTEKHVIGLEEGIFRSLKLNKVFDKLLKME